MRHHAARRDENEPDIIQALRQCGVQVFPLSGEGLPDLLLYRAGIWLPVEVKTATGKLRPAQQKMMDAAPFPVVRSVEEALALPILRRAR